MTARVRQVTNDTNDISFRCPGCGDIHTVPTSGPKVWKWNGELDLPTLTPSLSVKSGHYASSWRPGDPCWCGKNYGFSCYRCHSFITDGRIKFLSDSTHALSGQTVDLPELVAGQPL